MIKVLFICHGNICRSPLAQFYFQDLVQKNGLSDRFLIDSAATSNEEIGNPVHPGTRRKLAEAGISCAGKTAWRMTKKEYREFDYLIGMDSWNIRNMVRITGGDPDHKIYKMMEFADSGWKAMVRGIRNMDSAPDVADPWYTGDFEATWRDVTAGCQGLLEYLKSVHNL